MNSGQYLRKLIIFIKRGLTKNNAKIASDYMQPKVPNTEYIFIMVMLYITEIGECITKYR